jgi:hypothetical protein
MYHLQTVPPLHFPEVPAHWAREREQARSCIDLAPTVSRQPSRYNLLHATMLAHVRGCGMNWMDVTGNVVDGKSCSMATLTRLVIVHLAPLSRLFPSRQAELHFFLSPLLTCRTGNASVVEMGIIRKPLLLQCSLIALEFATVNNGVVFDINRSSG